MQAHTISAGLNGGAGTITVAGGTFTCDDFLRVADGINSHGTLWLTGGRLSALSQETDIANAGFGQLIVSNGVWQAANVVLSAFMGGAGTLTIAGGTNAITGPLTIGGVVGQTGAVWITGGSLAITNTPATATNNVGFTVDGAVTVNAGSLLVISNLSCHVGRSGNGSVLVNGGTFSASDPGLGTSTGGRGTFTCVAGLVEVRGKNFEVGLAAGATGTLSVNGGTVIATNINIVVGDLGRGQLTQTNGALFARSVAVGVQSGAAGTLTALGGTAIVSSNITVGNCSLAVTGSVLVAGGSVYVTNAAHTGVLDIRNGTVELDSGTLVIDKLVITNACGHFIHAGGTVSITMTNVSPNLDADGDGIPNGSDLDAFDPADAGNDPDGDGFTNLQEFQAGTNPTNSASFLGITGIVTEGNNIRITWMTGPNKTNALERTAGAAGSFATNNFAAITNIITVGTVTNYLDVGAATNVPAFYYRVRLVP